MLFELYLHAERTVHLDRSIAGDIAANIAAERHGHLLVQKTAGGGLQGHLR